MTPTRGFCHSVFLLVQAASVKPRQTVNSWVEAARRSPTFMASAFDLESTAQTLLQLDLARVECNIVRIDHRLNSAGRYASIETLALIARVLLDCRRPQWLAVSVKNGAVLDEWVPTSEQRDLEWLGDLRNPILIDLHSDCDDVERFREWLGGVGERLVVAIERQRGRTVRHVARISDAFGFDIESSGTDGRICLEVKTTLESGADRFFITKNEALTAATLRKEWCLLQVVMDPTAATEAVVTRTQVRCVRLLRANEVLKLLPIDSSTGEWIDSARISPLPTSWADWAFEIPSSWCDSGYRNS